MDTNNRKIIILSDEQVEELNSLDSVKKFPDYLESPTLSVKVGYAKREETGGICVIAKKTIHKGEVICYSNGSIINRPIIYSYQIGNNQHLVGPGGLDHNCIKPNCGIDKNTNNFIALREIKPNEYLTFNYFTTEYDMNTPFNCTCGEEKCFGEIKGFKYLNVTEREFVRENFGLSSFIEKNKS